MSEREGEWVRECPSCEEGCEVFLEDGEEWACEACGWVVRWDQDQGLSWYQSLGIEKEAG